ncbi:MAG: sulfurtransferase TusA family protein, partial [Streptococcus thermophilus]
MTLVKLETGGLVCPFPLIDAKKKMAELAVGDELLIAFDCTQATESIPNW